MSYRCEQCQKHTDRRQKMLKQVIYKPVPRREDTRGAQIEREIKLCPACMAKTSTAA